MRSCRSDCLRNDEDVIPDKSDGVPRCTFHADDSPLTSDTPLAVVEPIPAPAALCAGELYTPENSALGNRNPAGSAAHREQLFVKLDIRAVSADTVRAGDRRP